MSAKCGASRAQTIDAAGWVAHSERRWIGRRPLTQWGRYTQARARVRVGDPGFGKTLCGQG